MHPPLDALEIVIDERSSLVTSCDLSDLSDHSSCRRHRDLSRRTAILINMGQTHSDLTELTIALDPTNQAASSAGSRPVYVAGSSEYLRLPLSHEEHYQETYLISWHAFSKTFSFLGERVRQGRRSVPRTGPAGREHQREGEEQGHIRERE